MLVGEVSAVCEILKSGRFLYFASRLSCRVGLLDGVDPVGETVRSRSLALPLW